jgi:oligoribonuclease
VKTEREPKLVWLDLETTCLDPNEPHAEILEAAIVVTEGDLTNLSEHRWVIGDAKLDIKAWSDEVVEMHCENGLVVECLRSNNRWSDVAATMTRIVSNNWYPDSKPLLCGNSVHFDRAWLNVFIPDIPKFLSHRHIDVSSIYEMLLRSHLRLDAHELKETRAGTPHRALDDVLDSINLYDSFRGLIGLD